jgi:hypothetical protein
MKFIKYIFIILFLIGITGCSNNNKITDEFWKLSLKQSAIFQMELNAPLRDLTELEKIKQYYKIERISEEEYNKLRKETNNALY